MLINNLLKLLKSKLAITSWIISFIIIISIMNHMMDYNFIVWNQWEIYANIEYYSNYIIAILFWLIVASFVYKLYFFKSTWIKESSTWFIWSFASILVIWCPACTITLATYIWIWGLLLALPFDWLEVKWVWIFLMLIWLYYMLRDLEVCKIKLNKK